MPARSTEEPDAPDETPAAERRVERRSGTPPPVPPAVGPGDPYLPLPDAERQGIALCLSGSGFRAALFHLGALKRLDELEILRQLWTISSVSGGGIVAAHVATRLTWPVPGRTVDWGSYVAAPLREFARARLLPRRIVSKLLAGWIPVEAQTDRLAKAFGRGLTRLSLQELPALPNFVFGGADPASSSLAQAIAASVEGFHHDHLAVEPVWRNHQTVLVSDGGGLFDEAAELEWEARELGKRWLISSFKTGVLEGTYWGVGSARSRYGIGGPSGYSKDFAKTFISEIRGDLDGLSEGDAAVLENHGYLLADAAIEAHAPHLISRPAPRLVIPHPDWMDEGSVERG